MGTQELDHRDRNSHFIEVIVESGSSTNLSLLLQLRRGDRNEEAWAAFVNRYGSRIYDWCLNRNLQTSDAEDVSQNVLIKLAKRLQNFEYDSTRSFRGWLRRVTENALADFFREQQRNSITGTADAIAQLELAEARQDLIERLESAFDVELLDKAKELVRNRVSEPRFLAWELSAQKGVSAIDIAAQLNMKVATVYTAKNQIQSLLQQELQKLEKEVNLG